MTKQRNREIHTKGAAVVTTRQEVARTFYPHVQVLDLHVLLQGRSEEGPKDDRSLPSWIRVWVPMAERRFGKAQGETTPVVTECDRWLALLEKFLSWVAKIGSA